MPMRFRFRTIKGQLMAWLFVAALLPLAVVQTILLRQRVAIIKHEAAAKLEAVRDLKVQRITEWVNEAVNNIRTVSEDPEVRSLLAARSRAGGRPDAAALTATRARLQLFLKYHASFSGIELLDPATGVVLVAADAAAAGADRTASRSFAEGRSATDVFIDDIHHSYLLRRRRMTLSLPLAMAGASPGSVAGVLVGDIDLTALDALLQERTGLGETGETLIVNRDLLALSNLRWRPGAPLRQTITGLPAIKAAAGNTGFLEGPDYRGTQVLAAYAHIPRTGWGFVAKQDVAELYAAVARTWQMLLLLVPVTIAMVYLMATAIARHFSRPVLEMRDTALRLEGGDLAARNAIDRADELGVLARTTNSLAEHVSQQITVQHGLNAVSAAAVASTGVQGFLETTLAALVAATGADLGAFFLRTGDGHTFAPAATVGLDPGLLGSFDGRHAEGALARTLTERRVAFVGPLPADTRFIYRTFAGDAVPNEFAAVPVVVDGEVRALVALASLRPCPAECALIVEKVEPILAIGLARALANDETRTLAGELARRNDELRAQAVELQRQADELFRQTEELQAQKEELEVQSARVEQANRLKSEFLSSMSHELRTPLNSVLALSRVLIMQAGERLTPEETSYLQIVERNGRHLLALINDVLDLARIEAGRMEVGIEPFSLAATLASIGEELAPVAAEKGLELTVATAGDLPVVASDERKVRQILLNIVGNAIKFTIEGSVRIAATAADDRVRITVADTGIGIAPEQLPFIFDEFRQADGGTARRFGGTGLGLAIADKLAHLLGGTIEATSEVGSGSVFTFTLPTVAGSAAPAGPQPVTAGPTTARPVLVVDDDPAVARLIAEYLEAGGYPTATAHSGLDALRLVRTVQPFAITLDVLMPTMDGWEVLQKLKRDPQTRGIPVIVVSVSEDRTTGYALGASGVLGKPVDRQRLLAELARVGMPPRGRALVVDDSDVDRQVITRLLEAEDLVVAAVPDGETALATLAAAPPDVMILDLLMPGLDGFDVLERARDLPGGRDVPVIVVTAKDLSRGERERLHGRVAAVLAKSSLPSGTLLAEIRRVLARIGDRGAASPGPRRLLLVEDNEVAAIQVRKVLEHEGFVVDVAPSGEDAIRSIAVTVPDGIVLDLQMPGIDGFEVLERMRSRPATAAVPVLILTAKDLTKGDFQRLSANNVQQLVQKGDIDRHGLVRKVKGMLGIGSKSDGTTTTSTSTPPSRPPAVPIVAPPPREPGRTPPTVLVVEDNPDNMTTMRAVLHDQCTLVEAPDGESGLALLRTHRPDLVLLDMSLPGLDGFAFVRRVRADATVAGTRIVALTAHAMAGDRERMLEAGCDDYLSKPVELDVLLGAVRKWTGNGTDTC